MSEMKNVFVTGAGGFIGRHLVAELLANNVSVSALMMAGEAEPPQFAGRVRTVVGDVRDLSSIDEEIGEFDTIFHLAAIVSDWGSKQSHIETTLEGTKQAIALALKRKAKFIVTTSVATYGSALGSGKLDEHTPIGQAASSYEYVKQLQEKVTLEAVKQQGLDAIVIRPANVYGIGSIWVTRYIELLKEKKPALMGKGNWDAGLVHVSNLVSALLLAGQHQQLKSGEIFVIADDPGVTWIDYLSGLSNSLGLPAPKSVPNIVARVLAPILETIGRLINQKSAPLVTHLAYRLTGVESIYLNTKAKRMLNYQPHKKLEQALLEIKNHYQ